MLPRVLRAGIGPTGQDVWCPKYLEVLGDITWGSIHYGGHETLFYADLTPAQHTQLAAQSDTIQFPADLDANLTNGQVTGARAYLDSIDVPSGWVNTNRTVRDVIRGIAGIFLLAQRVRGISRQSFFDVLPRNINRAFNTLSGAARSTLQQAASDLQLDVSGLTGSNTLRDFLQLAGQHWLSKPIVLAGEEI